MHRMRVHVYSILTAALAFAMMTIVATSSAVAIMTIGTPVASPVASPATDPAGCGQLGAYFQELAAFVLPNEGLAILESVNNDVLALDVNQAKLVSASLSDLVTNLDVIVPPPAAATYHTAYTALITWYRDMTDSRDQASHQRLINGDKRIVPAIGRAVYAGQIACGADVWNSAREAAFPPAP